MAAMTVTNAGLDLVRDALLLGTVPQVTWFAIGTSATAPAVTDVQLGAEVFRKQITSVSNGAAHGEGILNGYISPQDSVGTVIAEWGLFGGATASATANSGTLIARGLYSHTHTAVESIQLQADSTGA